MVKKLTTIALLLTTFPVAAPALAEGRFDPNNLPAAEEGP